VRDPREQLDAEDEGPRFSFDLSAPAPIPPTDIPPLPGLEPIDEAAMDPPILNPPTYQDLHLSAPAMIGTYDSWCGEVSKVYDSAADAIWGQKGVIEVRRASPYWTADPTFGLDEIPPVDSQPQRSVEHAFPFPAVDQQAYRVAEGDPVVVVTGRDGKCYYLPDDRPFIGVVAQSPASASTKEAVFGGAGNTTIKVTRQLLTGDPTDNDPAYGFTPLSLTYSYVYPLTAAGQHHGYRVGDTVLCFRRGMYMFCLPGKGVYHGKIVAEGPASEVDFTDERYWVEMLAVNVAYTGDTNVWAWAADGDSPFTVCAANLAELAGQTHKLPTDGTLEVLVTLLADTTASAKTPYWVFAVEPDEKVGVSSADTTPDYLRLTAAEVADPPEGRQHKLIGDNEADADSGPADQGHISVAIVNAADNEQAKICFDGPVNYGLVLLGNPDYCQPMVVVDFAGVVYGYYGWNPDTSSFVWFPAVAGTADPELT